MGRVAEDGGDPAGVLIDVNECRSLEAVAALPTDRERGIGFLDVDRFVLPVSGQPCREPIGGVEAPSIARFGGEQDQLTDGNHAAGVSGGPALTITHHICPTKTPSLYAPRSPCTPD